MKKLICLALCALILISVMAGAAVPAGAASAGKLILTDEGRKLGEVAVGNEFIFRVGLDTGNRTLINGQGNVSFDSAYISFVGYGDNWDSYCFSDKLVNTSLVANYTTAGIFYNFSKYSGIEGFTSVDEHYFKARFKAVAPGTTDIHHTIEVMTAREGDFTVRLFNKGKANEQLDPIPYSISSVDIATAYVGDANGDYDISVLDATFVQMITAGKKLSFNTVNTDVNSDGWIDLKDSLTIQRYMAGISVSGNIGKWIFETE